MYVFPFRPGNFLRSTGFTLMFVAQVCFADIQWMDFNKGLSTAESDNKYVFLDIYTNWCQYCAVMDKTTFKAKRVVQELKKNFVSIKLNAEGENSILWKAKTMTAAKFSSQIGVVNLPTLLFLSPKGEIVGSHASFADEEMMYSLLVYISSGARERQEAFEDFLTRMDK